MCLTKVVSGGKHCENSDTFFRFISEVPDKFDKKALFTDDTTLDIIYIISIDKTIDNYIAHNSCNISN